MVVAWIVFLISLSAIPCWNKLASCAANSNSLGALLMALAEFRAPWSRDGNMGHCFSTIKWLKISHCQPFWMRSHAGSSLGTSMACPFSGMQPCWMALKNAVVWEAGSGTRKEQQIQRVRLSLGWKKNCFEVCLETFLARHRCHGACCLLDDGLVGIDLLLPLGCANAQLHGHAFPKQLHFHSNGQHLLAFGQRDQP